MFVAHTETHSPRPSTRARLPAWNPERNDSTAGPDRDEIAGVISRFDRVVTIGALPGIGHAQAMSG